MHGEQGQEHREQVFSDGKGGEHCARGYGQEGSDDKSAEWSGEILEESEGLATEEEAATAGGLGWGREMQTSTTWGTQETGAEQLHREALARGGNNGKASSTATDKA